MIKSNLPFYIECVMSFAAGFAIGLALFLFFAKLFALMQD